MKNPSQRLGKAVCSLSLAGFAVGCVGDDTDEASETETAETEVAETEETDSETGGETEFCPPRGDTCSIDPVVCQEPPDPPAGEAVPFYAQNQTDAFGVDPNLHCPIALQLAGQDPAGNGLDDGVLSVDVHFPDDGGGLPPQELLPSMIFSHGNGQQPDQYAELMSVLTRRGLIGLSIGGGGTVGGPLRAQRILCVTEAVLEENVAWVGAGRLSGEVVFGGHSQGGRAALLAARHLLHGGFQTSAPLELAGVLSLAPAMVMPDESLIANTARPFFLVIQGSGDGDTTGAAFALYDQILPTEVVPETFVAPPKALVWAYGVDHSDWGGQLCSETPRAIALMESYIGDFIEASVYGDLDAWSTFFHASQPTPLLRMPAADPVLWDDYNDEPQIYGTSSQRVDPADGYQSWVVDRFENMNLDISDSGLDVQWSFRMYDQQANGGEPLVVNTHLTTVAVADLAENEVGFMEWCLSCEATEALAGSTSLAFRIGFERDEVGDCVGEDFPLPEISLIIETDSGEQAEVDLQQYARLALPDTLVALDDCTNTADPCETYSSMQATVRIPTQSLCQEGIVLDAVSRIRLEFLSPNPVENGFGTIEIHDDLEIRRSPGEPPVDCRCG